MAVVSCSRMLRPHLLEYEMELLRQLLHIQGMPLLWQRLRALLNSDRVRSGQATDIRGGAGNSRTSCPGASTLTMQTSSSMPHPFIMLSSLV